ncbi:MAG: hypothetical protein ACI4MC_06555 [Candidatus Coproplasma sp.]
MKNKTFKKYNSVLLTGILSAVLAVGCIGVTTTIASNKDNFVAEAYDSSYDVDPSKIGTGKTYYVAPDGKSENTENSSPENPASIVTLLLDSSILKPGDKVIVAPGSYYINMPVRAYASGEPGAYITVINEDPTQKAVLDFSGETFADTSRGIQIDGDFWYWYGVDICGAGDNGMYIGGSYNVIENCEFYNNRDTGLQLGRSYSDYTNITQWPSYNLIKNCTSYNNYDNETYGENADGFAAKLTVGYGNIFDGCIAYRNSDDGWDLYAKADSGNIGAVIMYNCVAFENGYIGETQESFNAKCGYYDQNDVWHSTYNSKFNEAITQSYTTRDGDGNGFKLGGSIMEGDVFLYNCMSFNNRMHGITDNSNPGVLSVNNVTTYNNAVGIDNDPESPNFGKIDFNAVAESCNNIDLARQTYSYNIMGGMLSVQDVNKNLGADRYRGSALNSVLLDASYGSVTIKDVADVSSFSEVYAIKGESGEQIPTSVFASVPSPDVFNGIDGTSVNSDIHKLCRNADGSINMGEILKIVDYDALYSGADKDSIGAYLIGESWDDYTHYDYVNATHSADKDEAAVDSAHATLNLNTNINATFQDFDLTTIMEDVTITWSSNNTDIIKIVEGETSISGTKDARAVVYRTENDELVTLTATITCNRNKDVQRERNFNIVVKADCPTIGEAVLSGVEDGMRIDDRYDNVPEPKFTVTNAADYNGKLLSEDLYTVETQYLYATSKTAKPVEIAKVTSSVPGVYTINKTVTLKSDGSKRSYSYMIYVAGRSANVQFMESTEAINVNCYGFTIAGEVSSPAGKIYTLVSDTQLTDITAAKVMEEGIENEFRAININYQYENENLGNYYIYYVLGNYNGEVTADVKEIPVQTVEIKTADDFKAMLLNNNSSTIYLLTDDIDLSGETDWVSEVTSKKVNFTGLFNGMGHTIKGLNVSSGENELAAMFYRLSGGTIENVKFEDITINGAQKVGLVATSYGGFIHNVSMTNVKVSGEIRVGGLVGQILAGETTIDQVSFVNDKTYTKATSVKASDFDANTFYVKEGDDYVKATEYEEGVEYYTLDAGIKGDRMGAIVGFIQASSASDYARTTITNCFVENVFGTGSEQYCASIVGRYDDRNARDYLLISNCYSNSIMRAMKYQGGIIGGQTGAGVLRISNCIFTGELYYAANLATRITQALKNCSGIMGYFASNGDTLITNCYAPLQEYNTDYEVDMSDVLLGRIEKADFWNIKSKFDLENKWTLCTQDSDLLAAPYVTLNFLGNWN